MMSLKDLKEHHYTKEGGGRFDTKYEKRDVSGCHIPSIEISKCPFPLSTKYK
jgi:hypothetical protein